MGANGVGQGGVNLTKDGAEFSVWSLHAERVELCLFDAAGDTEVKRLPMMCGPDNIHRVTVDGAGAGTRYGYRAHGVYDPDRGFWFDPSKLLLDPYATEIDRPYRYDARLSQYGTDTAAMVPKAIVTRPAPVTPLPPVFRQGGFVYEVSVRAFTMLHPEIPEKLKGTVAALAHPAVIRHLKRIGVDAVELMPITAWIDERHLPPLGLVNSWGYNPVGFMALDPRLVPGGIAELRDTVAALRAAGIGTLLDLVFNHTGESDRFGATVGPRGLDNPSTYRHVPGEPGTLVNDTGCGNTVDCDNPYIRQLIVDSLRHFVVEAGVDGFRFDLAPILLRTAHGYRRDGATAQALVSDPVLADRILIAEPWDIGPGGYQLGNFPQKFEEWNDRARDDLRRYWRGEPGTTGDLATALAGSAPIFSRNGGAATRSVNFIAAHDGFTLMDLVSYSRKHNEANGEDNRDGHDENHSWNNGVEGATTDAGVLDARRRDVKALLSTLFSTRGTVMLTAGDEGGRSQTGNNNAYCQDNAITWMDWTALDETLIDHTAFLSDLRKRFSALSQATFFTGQGDVEWLSQSGQPMAVSDWEYRDGTALTMVLTTDDRQDASATRLAILINRSHFSQDYRLPAGPGRQWRRLDGTSNTQTLGPRSVAFFSNTSL